MADVFIKLNQGAAVSWKAAVNTLASLPSTGNTEGDVRITKDTSSIYIWDGAAWVAASGGSGSPGGASGTIQFNNAGVFGGDSELTWDNSGKVLGLNGLDIKALSSSVSLVNNMSSPTTAFSYSASTYPYSIIEYSISRNTARRVGRILVCTDGTNGAGHDDFTDYNDTGIVLSVTVSAGNVNIKYTTTNTGFNGFLKYSIRQWA